MELTPEQEVALHTLLWSANLPAVGGGPHVQTLVLLLQVFEHRSQVRHAMAEKSIATVH